ncbi:DNA polymerase III subunit alpha [Candidatus Cyanaurora vandensis]|uniref:DNA polymerase III subunit alpha n=1 Tax=Candidatus Cyanaurora vandensis TaxID=2714958 RepID=UPI00257FA3DE|nr:DNA polymerase III subunit alpha [Candidatus Cyanaurora vandensis]
MSFVGLHVHSEYSLLDGASQLPQLVEQARQLGMPGLALTDHGVMYGAIELIKLCRKAGIKPIVGVEGYIVNADTETAAWKAGTTRVPRYHQVILAKNIQGYKNLVKLVTGSHLHGEAGKGIFKRPCISKKLLAQHRAGLIVTSACLGGEIPQAILQGRPDKAREIAIWYQEHFGADFYLELQDHGSREDRIVNVVLVGLARELGIKLIATNDSHFTCQDDVDAHDALLCIQTGKLLTEEKRLRYTGTEYLKSAEQMALMFRDHLDDDIIQEAISNTLEVSQKVETYYQELFGEARMPNFPVPASQTADSYLKTLTHQGLRERFQERKIDEEGQEKYRVRLHYELEMIEKMGFSNYFLVVWDYIRFAREKLIPVGPGRGSAAGSLVAYALRITNIDPVQYDLLFERFLNPERKSMPDIDTDFCIDRRVEIIDYVTAKYGSHHVAQIITFNRLTSKAVLKDVARVMDIPYAESDRMAKWIPVFRGKPAKLKVMVSAETPSPEFKQAYESDPRVKKWVDLALRLENTNKTYGVHAAGVVISRDPLDEIVPLQRNKEGQVITQYYMEDIADLGLLKMDFLGLRNLTMIQQTLNLITKTRRITLNLDNISIADEKTYKLLGDGELSGIFQLESSGMKQIVKDLKPSCMDDIGAILALYRPGPLDSGMIPNFIARKHDASKIQYACPELKPILKDTYATILYQEQIMRIAQDLGGYSLGQADLLRRAMGKKKKEEMEKHRSQFIDGACKNGIRSEIADDLFEQMVVFAEYCFNKSHSIAYGFITYQTAYLKANYPVEYMASLLSSVKGDQDKAQKYLADCMNMNLVIQPPDINRSDSDFTPAGNQILFGLGAVKNVGEGVVDEVLQERGANGSFTSLGDLCSRLPSANKRALEALIKAGALDSLLTNRNQLLMDLDAVLAWAADRVKERAVGQFNLFDVPTKGNDFSRVPQGPKVPDFEPQEKLKYEKELLGFYVSDHPLKDLKEQATYLAPTPLASLNEQSEELTLSVLALLTEIKAVTTKKGERMAVLFLEDLTGSAEAVVFPKIYERIQGVLVVDRRLVLWGRLDRRDDRSQLVIMDCEPVEQVSLVVVELDLPDAQNIAQQDRIRNILKANQREEGGHIPVVARIQHRQRQCLVRLGPQFRVNDAQATVKGLQASGFRAELKHLVPKP